MKKRLKPKGIIVQTLLIFLFSTLAIGIFTYFTQMVTSEGSVKSQTEDIASNVAEETMDSIREYPAYRWLLEYWRNHSDEMDIEYDAEYSGNTKTQEKVRLLREHQPELYPEYAGEEDILRLPAEDQKLYAEIVYAWTITRINQIKQAYGMSFLFCLMTDDSCEKQFFLLSGADPGAVRGQEYEQVYTLGVTSDVAESQTEGMKLALENSSHLANAGIYMDYYAAMDRIGDQNVMIGLTYDLSELRRDIRERTIYASVLAMFLEMILAWICLGMMYQMVLQPLRTVQGNIGLYMKNKDSAEVCRNLEAVRPTNEIGDLSRDISRLTLEVDDYLDQIQNITKEKERINAELTLATQIQANMLPSTFPAFPENPEFEVIASMEPAREVGGDFYDFFLLDDDHLCLLIADVSGKGIPAALFMMASQIILKNNASADKTPAQILEETNDMICANNREDMFVTVWLGILEISSGRLTAANGGHEYPVLGKSNGSFQLIKDKHGPAAGALEGMKYHDYELQLEPGEKLFLYTDGVPEATDKENNMFGTTRMVAALQESGGDPAEVLHDMSAAVKEFVQGAEQFDDITMLCLEYHSGGDLSE